MSADPISSQSIACYMRVSTDEQRIQGTIDTQRAAIERYLAIQGVSPVGWYVDDGVSGTHPLAQRPEGARLLADCRAGRISTVLFHKLDRLGRSVRVLIDVRDELMELGVELVSINEHLDTSTAAGRMFFNQLSTFAEFERDTIVERSALGTARRLDEGAWQGGRAPFGLTVQGKDKDARLVPDTAPFPNVPDLSPMAVVRLVYEKTVTAGWTCQQIADHLNAHGVPTPASRGKGIYKRGEREHPVLGIWRANRVREILVNPTYKGVYTYGRRTRNAKPRELVSFSVGKPEDAIVSVETWDAAQAALHRHQMWSPRNAHHDYLLRGLIACGECGRTFIGVHYPGGYRYVCTGKRRAKALYGSALAEVHRCPSTAIPADAIEQAIWTDIEGFIRNPGSALDALAQQMRGQTDQAEAIRADIAHIQSQVDGQQREKDTVLALFRKGRISESDLDRQLDDIAREEATLRTEIERLQSAAASAREMEERLTSAGALLTRLHTSLEAGVTPAKKREVIEALVQEIRVTVDQTGTTRFGNPQKRATVHVSYCFDERILSPALEMPNESSPAFGHGLSRSGVRVHAGLSLLPARAWHRDRHGRSARSAPGRW